MNAPRSNPRSPWGFLVVAVAAVAATGISLYLFAEHLRSSQGGWYAGICDPNRTVMGLPLDCEKVNTSPYSTLLGIPLSLLGAAFYPALLVLGLIGLSAQGEWRAEIGRLLASLGLALVLYAAGLGVVQATQIRALCPFCLALYLLHAAVWVGGTWASPDPLGRSLAGSAALLPQLFRRPLLIALAGLFILTTALGQALYLKKGRAARARSEAAALPGAIDVDIAQLRRTAKRDVAVSSEDASTGPVSAPYTLVEFSDFLCPFCRQSAQEVRRLKREGHDDLRVVFKHFPLDSECNPLLQHSLHQGACTAARSAICAQRFGKFWEWHDWLFDNQGTWNTGDRRANLLAEAQRRGMAPEAFGDCLDHETTRAQLKRDIDEGARLEIGGTPAFLLNGHPLFRLPPETAGRAPEITRRVLTGKIPLK